MDNRFAQQMKKGVLDMIVLKLISEKDTYGYELLQELEKRGDGFFDLKEGTLYPVLYRLEDGGLIEASWKNGEGRTVPKKYYRITEDGRKLFAEYRDIWSRFSTCVERICGEEEP
ncbi:PadR family transcriptional regulator [Ruminococcus sp. CLA-AA-H200]|uniref:PadR family transcriptional regulator n=1 Tax=Ruminococcus turbiniformis TaxID=2881258 RepID=A0ABS8FWV0_9FIRM|nr:PadR family transcriptional regulator [Ruminococcus turbiniformis]MCC2254505.1 PadR family transcriptional regulator [Ruminococcus turbiniformis]